MGADQGKASKRFRRVPWVDLKHSWPFWKKHFQSGHDRSRNRFNVGTQAQLFDNLTVACHNASSLSADRVQVGAPD